MGILNITPDSFYDGGLYADLTAARQQARQLVSDGADIIDLGAESTRPGARLLDAETELDRLREVLPELVKQFTGMPFSLDTRHASCAAFALSHGAKIINDVSGCNDPAMPEILAGHRPAYVLTHPGFPADSNWNSFGHNSIITGLLRFFENKINMLVKHGLPENHIAIDPGIGFGKTPWQNLEILRKIQQLHILKKPILGAISMKSFFGALLNHEVADRACDTAIASVLLWQKGIYWHRAHKVHELADAFRLANALSS